MLERLLVETDDVETGHDLLRRLYADHTPRLSGDPRDYRFRYEVNSLDGFGVDRMRHSLRVETDLEPYHLLSVAGVRGGRMVVRSGGHSERVGPGDRLLVDPLRPLSVTMDDADLIPVRLDLDATRALAEELTGVDAGRVEFGTTGPVGPAQARYWRATVEHTARNVLADDEVASRSLVRAEAFRQLATAFLMTFPNTAVQALTDRPGARTRGAGPAALRRAVEFVDGNAHRDIGPGDIARAARVGPRALRGLFVRHRGRTPEDYLRRVRMEAAHRELRAADPAHGNPITAIAARWGFADVEQFSRRYRAVYGRSPDDTLHDRRK